MRPIYDAVRAALKARGWATVRPQETERGELLEFVPPKSEDLYTWMDALAHQQYLEATGGSIEGVEPPDLRGLRASLQDQTRAFREDWEPLLDEVERLRTA